MSPQAAAVIVDAVRTPAGKGKPGGAPSGVHPSTCWPATRRRTARPFRIN